MQPYPSAWWPPHTILAAASVMIAIACAGSAEASDKRIERGRMLAERLCARCHAVALGDASPLAKAPPLRDLGKRYPIESLAEAFAEGIVTRHREMPEFRFSTDDIDGLLAFLSELDRRSR